MPIKGLTNRRHADDTGKPVRLGFLQKGWREGFGKNIKLHDADYFIFKAAGNDHASEKMHQVFKSVYGEQPRAIDDVRIPVGVAGNFNIADKAWLTAHKHTEQGSVFLARSDGENIKQARDPRSGKVRFYYDGEMPHAEHVTVDGRGNDCFQYQGRLYPFVQQMMIDLTLPAFNRALYQEGLSGSGVVTFITHATWDIANLMDEYDAILDEVMGVYNDGSRSPNVVRNWLPLRDIPLRLFRSEDKITTPAWKKDAAPGDRYSDTRDLVHWQLNPEFAAAVQHARDQRTQLTLQAIAQAPMLMAGQAANSAADRLALANRDFFDVPLELGDGEPTGEDEPENIMETGPDWEALSELDEALEGELVEDEAPVLVSQAPRKTKGRVVRKAPPSIDWRGKLASNARPTVGTVASVLVAAGIRPNEPHAVASIMRRYPDLGGTGHQLSTDEALLIWDSYQDDEEE